MPEASAQPGDLLGGLLRDVSRSFYLTLRALPRPVRTPIGLAYLLARATDTIADTEIVPVDRRLAALDQLRARVLGRNAHPLDFSSFTGAPADVDSNSGSAAERRLLDRIEAALACLEQLPPPDRDRIRAVLATITSGQELDLHRFGAAPLDDATATHHVRALDTDADLEDYTYRVAGCVGEFWTGICRAHLFPRARVDPDQLVANGIRFGQGLQLVNILRDLPADLRKGRCYLPRAGLARAGLAPEDLLDPANESRVRPVYDHWLERAERHLEAGWTYTNALPWRCARVRLACSWPVLIGIRTLGKLRGGNVLDGSRRIKIGRGAVRNVLVWTVLLYAWPAAWRRLFRSGPGRSLG